MAAIFGYFLWASSAWLSLEPSYLVHSCIYTGSICTGRNIQLWLIFFTSITLHQLKLVLLVLCSQEKTNSPFNARKQVGYGPGGRIRVMSSCNSCQSVTL